uniref:Uncharacterized protein n=1 Tax=Anguilla anguilla TaxID=7936 RepID=A0A0E9WMH8_ANGAN
MSVYVISIGVGTKPGSFHHRHIYMSMVFTVGETFMTTSGKVSYSQRLERTVTVILYL